ncbi:MAG: hypothetical protein PF448_00430 [Bacteroidales bacterium]|jgi:hypothetical protein|nr:hypothetical protein [Bacteroidales bacterium]
MNTKKSTILLVLLSAVILPLFTGCFGVGEDDPFISLRTRKARMIGNWEVSAYYKNVKQIYGINNNTVLRVITDVQGDEWLETTEIIGSEQEIEEVEGIVINNEMQFDKNGYFNAIYEYQIVEGVVDEESLEVTTTTFTVKETMDGTWNFLGRIDDYSNKERLSLVVMNSKITHTTVTEIQSDDDEEEPIPTTNVEVWTYNYANGEMSMIWELDMLKNDEIHMYQDLNNFYQTSSDAAGSSFTEVGYQEKTLITKGEETNE